MDYGKDVECRLVRKVCVLLICGYGMCCCCFCWVGCVCVFGLCIGFI